MPPPAGAASLPLESVSTGEGLGRCGSLWALPSGESSCVTMVGFSVYGRSRSEGPLGPSLQCRIDLSIILVALAAGAGMLLAAASAGVAGVCRGCGASCAAVALGACCASLFRIKLMGVARGMGCPATFCGNFTLAVAVHGCEAAPGARLLSSVAVLVLICLIGVGHFNLL
jgi:hypothetical protein